MTDKCQYVRSDLSHCRANRMRESYFCFFHDPAMAAKRTLSRKAGGKHRRIPTPADSAPLRLSTVSEVIVQLENTINRVRDGHINAKDANAIGCLSGILLKALEQGRVEERLTALEQILHRQSSRLSGFVVDILVTTPLLMKWNAEIMDALIEPIEKLVSLHNASYEQFPIDLAELQESVQPDVEHLVEQIVGSAKATAVETTGDARRAGSLRLQLLDQNIPP